MLELIAPATLMARVREKTEEALAHGSFEPLETESEVVEDAGVRFVVRVVRALQKKPRARNAASRNPFLPPYDPHLTLGALAPAHVCLLNKYNVLPHHILIVTRAFEPQEALLTPDDFEAWWRCLAEIDGLGFYNAGAAAGASQPHKHMQLVPVPLGEGAGRTPVDQLVAQRALPFAHAVAPFAADPVRAHATYLQLLSALGCAAPGAPYNLLVTREWMWAVPRTQARVDDIEVNALGFAGALLARERAQLERIRARGPMTLLQAVSRPRQTP